MQVGVDKAFTKVVFIAGLLIVINSNSRIMIISINVYCLH